MEQAQSAKQDNVFLSGLIGKANEPGKHAQRLDGDHRDIGSFRQAEIRERNLFRHRQSQDRGQELYAVLARKELLDNL